MFVLFHVNMGWVDVKSVILVEEVVGEACGFEEDFDVEQGSMDVDYLTSRKAMRTFH